MNKAIRAVRVSLPLTEVTLPGPGVPVVSKRQTLILYMYPVLADQSCPLINIPGVDTGPPLTTTSIRAISAVTENYRNAGREGKGGGGGAVTVTFARSLSGSVGSRATSPPHRIALFV